ncbi:MAG: VWA domain-containing protein [Promethearchaeota archaeon]
MKLKWFLLVILFSLAIIPQTFAQGELEESYETPEGNFIFYYTDDFGGQPLNAVTSLQVQDFGDLLEAIRTKELGYGFNDPGSPKPIEIFEQGKNAHGGAGGMNYDPYWLGGTASATEPFLVGLHEFFHVIQGGYGLTSSGGTWVTEGQARSLQDKLYNDLDLQDGSDYASYLGQVFGYLGNPDRTLMELSYDAALWWTYVAEKYGTINTEPDYGLDAFLEWWEAADSIGTASDQIAVFNDMLDSLGHPTVTFEDVFKDYVVSLYAKGLSGPNVPDKYKYKDETQTPGPYRAVAPNVNKTLPPGGTEAGTDYIAKWAPKYYIVSPEFEYNPDTGQEAGIVNVDVKQISSDTLFYDLLVVKDNDIVEETRITGTHFSRSVYTDADFLVLIVAGLDNTPTDPAKYHWSFSSGLGLSVEIQSPLNAAGNRARVGDYNDPEKFLAIVEILANANPLQGLTYNDFLVKVGSNNATVVSSTYIYGLYFLEIQAPAQAAAGLYDLEIFLSDAKDKEFWSVDYTDQAIDTSVVIDKSGSMSYDEKIDAAQAAARLYVNSLLMDDLLSLVQFETDALLLKGLDKVSSNRNDVLDEIDLIIADGPATSVGDGIFIAQNELFTNGDSTHENHIVLLTDGQENAQRWISDVDQFLWDGMNNTRLHVILIGIDSEAEDLQNVAITSGGSVHFAFDPSSGTLASDLARIYRSIIERQSKEYRVFSTMKTKSGTWTVSEQFGLDQARSATVVFNYNSTSSLNSGHIKLKFPNGTQISSTYFRQKSSASSNYYGHYVFKINNPPGGQYEIVSASSKSGDVEYFTEAAVRSPISINMYFGLDVSERFVAKEVPILVTLADDNGPITGAEVIAEVSTGLGYHNIQKWDLHLYDDGAHGDGFANDGTYGNYFTRTKDQGTYMVSVRATGTSSTYGDFTREISESFHLYDDRERDADGDGLPTHWEELHGLNPYKATGDDGASGDPDGDGLPNIDELKHGTSPTNPDTDGGGENDGSEVNWSRDPYWPDDDGFAPPQLQAEPGDQRVTIIFSVEPSYDSLNLYRSDVNSTTGFVLVKSGIAPTGMYDDTGLINNKTYWYKMMAISPLGEESSFSSVVSATPRPENKPPFGFVTINNGAKFTNTTNVNLTLTADFDVVEMRISQDSSFDGVPWVPFSNFATFILGGTGLQFVFVQFKDAVGNIGGGEHGEGTYFYDGIDVNTSAIIPTSTTSTWTPTVPTNWDLMFSVSALIAITLVVAIYGRRQRKVV